MTYTVMAAAMAAVHLLAFRAAHEAPRASFVAAVLGIAGITNLVWLGRRRRVGALLSLSRREAQVALAIAAFTITGNLAIAWAITSLGPGQAATITQTEIFFVAAVAWLGLGERPSRYLAVGAAIASVGVVLAKMPGAHVSFDIGGVAWALCAALSFAMILVIARGNAHAIDVERVNVARLFIAAPLLFVVPGAAAGIGELSGRVWGLALAAALVGPVASRLFQLYAVKSLKAASVKLGMLTTAVFAYLLDAAVFGRIPTPVEVAAAALILCGAAIPAWVRARRS